MAGRAPRTGAAVSGVGARVAVVVSRFHQPITSRLLEGAQAALRRHGVADARLTVTWVPGAFELPQVAMRIAASRRVDAVVCLGCVIRGETPHFDYVASEAARGIAEVGRTTGVPVTFGVITANTRAQAVARAGGRAGNRGEEAALAALELIAVMRDLGARRR